MFKKFSALHTHCSTILTLFAKEQQIRRRKIGCDSEHSSREILAICCLHAGESRISAVLNRVCTCRTESAPSVIGLTECYQLERICRAAQSGGDSLFEVCHQRTSLVLTKRKG